MPPTMPPLMKVDLTIPAWPEVERARRRLDAVRSAVGRVATVAGIAAAAIGLFTPAVAGGSLLATAVLSSAGLAGLRLWKPSGHQKAAATALYLVPGASLAALLIAEQVVPGIHWGEALGLTVWSTATWM
ncbi:hypothetical protein, partial [Planotetraspora phitsanulokensis]